MAETEAGAGHLHDALLAAHARLRVVVTERAEADRFVREALSALQELFTSFGHFLEQALRALDAPMGRGVANAFILEARLELDELAACRTVEEIYVEALTITELDGKSASFEVEGYLGAAVR